MADETLDDDVDDDAAAQETAQVQAQAGRVQAAALASHALAGEKRARSSRADAELMAEAPPRVMLARRAVVVADMGMSGADHLGEAACEPLSQLRNECRRVAGADGTALVSPRVSYRTPRPSAEQAVHRLVLARLLRPKEWQPPAPGEPFLLSPDQLNALCAAAETVLQAEPTVLRVRAPVKIYGDLHGQFGDLMRLFEAFGAPSREALGGDINLVDYLFLGDYVDRGSHSLETVCLLLALKVEHPNHVHLLRGNHEGDTVNRFMGLYDECVERFGQQAGAEVWIRLNDVFDWLPLAAIVQDRILCVHAGIGQNVRSIADVEAVQRPIAVSEGGDLLTDLLWSDPTEHDSIVGIHENHKRGAGVVSYGPDTVRNFCAENGLDLIVRGHECIEDGIERFAGGHLITVFSATNYCGVAGNSGGLLLVGRDLEVTPKLIRPVAPLTPPSPPTPFPGGAPRVEDETAWGDEDEDDAPVLSDGPGSADGYDAAAGMGADADFVFGAPVLPDQLDGDTAQGFAVPAPVRVLVPTPTNTWRVGTANQRPMPPLEAPDLQRASPADAVLKQPADVDGPAVRYRSKCGKHEENDPPDTDMDATQGSESDRLI